MTNRGIVINKRSEYENNVNVKNISHNLSVIFRKYLLGGVINNG
jgi:hypothetical protein